MTSYFKGLYEVTHNVNTQVIGDIANYTTVNGDEFEIRVVFDNGYERVDQLTQTVVSSNECVANCHLNNFPEGIEPEPNDELEIDGNTYVVIDAEEDGEGGVRLIMHKA